MRIPPLLLILVSLAALSCGGAPDVKLPPVDWEDSVGRGSDAFAGETPVSETWWLAFESPELDTLIHAALARNHDLRAAAARVEQAKADARIAGAALWPQLNGGLAASRSRSVIIGIPIPGAVSPITTYSNRFSLSADAAWEIDLWGRIRSAKSSSLARFEGSQVDLAAARLSLAATTARLWFALSEAEMQRTLAEETVASFRSSTERIRRRYQLGVRSPLDLRLAEFNLASAEALLAAREDQRDALAVSLQRVIGAYPDASFRGAADLPSLGEPVPAGLPSDLLLRRPDVVSAERAVAAARAQASSARRALLPSISLTGSGGTLSDQFADLLDGDFSVWSIAGGILQPLFQGGRLRANVARADAVRDQSLAAYLATALGAFGEVELALRAEPRAAIQVRSLMRAAHEADAAKRLAENQYDNGLIDYITMLESQRAALNARSQEMTARRAALDARLDLFVALGGGFDSTQDDFAGFLAVEVAE